MSVVGFAESRSGAAGGVGKTEYWRCPAGIVGGPGS
jgi:hypothetical protein